MAEADIMICDSEKSALCEAVKNFLLYKMYKLCDIQLLEVKLDNETKELESFLSRVTRVRVAYRCDLDSEVHRVSFIVKKVPRDGYQSRIVRSCRAFERERAFYKAFFPVVGRVVQSLRHSYKVEDNFHEPLPDFLFASESDDGAGEFIILEDIGAKGYRLPCCVSKVQGLDLDHCLLAVRGIGRFHALAKGVGSFYPRQRTDSCLLSNGLLGILVDHSRNYLHWIIRRLKRYRSLYRVASVAENLFPPSDDYASGGVSRMIPELGRDAMWYDSDRGQEPSVFLDVVKKRTKVVLYIASQLDGLPREAEESGLLEIELEKVWSLLIRFASTSRSGWNVINHGDCWINNMLFRYETDGDGCEKPADMMFIDFQFSRYCHPAIDLLYFLYTSTHRYFRELHFNLLVSKYHSSLVETLMHHAPIPISLDDLKSDLRGEYQPFGVIIGTFFAPYLKLEKEATKSCDDSLTMDAYEEFVKDGNSSAALRQFHRDAMFRSFMEENVRELTEVIFPNGDLRFVNQYWM